MVLIETDYRTLLLSSSPFFFYFDPAATTAVEFVSSRGVTTL